MTLDEAIKHYEDQSEEMKKESTIKAYEKVGFTKDDCLECANRHEQLARWLTELKELRKFAEFTAREVLDDDFEDCSGAFAEIACRKLVKLGYVKLDGDVYKRGSEE